MKTTLIAILFSFIYLNVSAQDKYLDIEPDGKLNLSGKWQAECAHEYVNPATTKHCDLCPFIIDAEDKSKAQLKDIELTFTYDSILIKRPSESISVPYSMNSDTIQFNFYLKETKKCSEYFIIKGM